MRTDLTRLREVTIATIILASLVLMVGWVRF